MSQFARNPFPGDPLFSRCFDYSPPEGWDPLVESCIADIRAMLDEASIPPGVFSIRQVKEKFGGLRIYTDGSPAEPKPDNEEFAFLGMEKERASSYYLNRIGNLDFEDQVSDETRARILAAIVAVAYVPEALAERIRARIKVAMDEADKTCQTCGAPGELEVKGWHRTVCAEHRTPS